MKKYLILIMVIGIYACKPNAKEMASYVVNPENGLVVQNHNDGIYMELKYVPAELILEREKSNGILTKSQENERLKKLNLEEHYELFIQSNQEYLNTDLLELKMKQESETLPAFFHVENIGVANRCRVILSFNKENVQKGTKRDIEISLNKTKTIHLEVLAEDIKEFEEYYNNWL